MNDVSLGELLVRMVVSLGVVLALVLGAYTLLRRRQGLPSARSLRVGGGERGRGRGGAMRTALVRPRAGGSLPRQHRAGNRRGLSIVGRVGVSRTSSVVAVQFADRVFMLGTSEQGAPSVLAEVPLTAWDEATEVPEDLSPIVRPAGTAGAAGAAGAADGVSAGERRPSFLDALREATARRG